MISSIKPYLAQQIAEAIKEVCEHDINFIDTNGIIFASTNQKRIGDYHEIGRTVARTAETIEVAEEQLSSGVQQGVNLPFQFHDEVLAVIGISGSPDKVRQYARLAQRITSLLLREHELEQQEQRQKTELHQLLRAYAEREPVHPDYLKQILGKYQIKENENYRFAWIRTHALPEPKLEAIFVQAETPVYTALSYENYLLLFEDKKLPRIQTLLHKLEQEVPGSLKIGIGKAENLLHLHQSCRTALLSLNSLGKEAFLAVYDHLTLELLLGGLSDDAAQVYLNKIISQLDPKKKELLNAYFASNNSLKTTCETLFIHKNTLQYQLDRIYQITGLNPRYFQDAVLLYLALRLEAFSSNRKHLASCPPPSITPDGCSVRHLSQRSGQR